MVHDKWEMKMKGEDVKAERGRRGLAEACWGMAQKRDFDDKHAVGQTEMRLQ